MKITVNMKIIEMNSLFYLLLSFYFLDYFFLYLNVVENVVEKFL